MNNIIEINIDQKVSNRPAETLHEGRTLIVEQSLPGKQIQSEVTIMVQAYNRLEKTKRCIESILKYTEDVIRFAETLVDVNSSTNQAKAF